MKNLNLLLIFFINEKKIIKDKNILIKFERSPIINAINKNIIVDIKKNLKFNLVLIKKHRAIRKKPK